MRCYCCNRALSDYESTLKSVATGNYLDTCMKCLQDLDIEFVGNTKNSDELDDVDQDWFEEELDAEQEDDEEDF